MVSGCRPAAATTVPTEVATEAATEAPTEAPTVEETYPVIRMAYTRIFPTDSEAKIE